MFHLTPQEKSALAWVLTVCLLGAVIHFALQSNARPMTWVKAVGTKTKPQPPDINTSTFQQLDKVPGIGPKTAQNIVDYRAQHGPFLRLEELRKVKGITKNNFQKIQKYYGQERQAL